MYNKTFNRVFFVSIDIIKGDKMKKILMCVLLISGVDADEYSVEEIRIAKCMVGFNKIRARTGRNRTTLLGSMCNKHNAILYTDGTYSISPFHDRLNDNCNLTKADVWENAQRYKEVEKYCKLAGGFTSTYSFQEMRKREYDSVDKSIIKRKKKTIEDKEEERKRKLLEMVKKGEI